MDTLSLGNHEIEEELKREKLKSADLEEKLSELKKDQENLMELLGDLESKLSEYKDMLKQFGVKVNDKLYLIHSNVSNSK